MWRGKYIHFNSIKVQLKQRKASGPRLLDIYFNSIKVQLKLCQRKATLCVCIFQFHKGTIKTPLHLCAALVPSYFNSIKVQLKLAPLWCLDGIRQFQFHKGTIKTVLYISSVFAFSYFNSIKVQLKQYRDLFFLMFFLNFNSIKVQLKRKRFIRYNVAWLFQFHKGTIKTCLWWTSVIHLHISIP